MPFVYYEAPVHFDSSRTQKVGVSSSVGLPSYPPGARFFYPKPQAVQVQLDEGQDFYDEWEVQVWSKMTPADTDPMGIYPTLCVEGALTSARPDEVHFLFPAEMKDREVIRLALIDDAYWAEYGQALSALPGRGRLYAADSRAVVEVPSAASRAFKVPVTWSKIDRERAEKLMPGVNYR